MTSRNLIKDIFLFFCPIIGIDKNKKLLHAEIYHINQKYFSKIVPACRTKLQCCFRGSKTTWGIAFDKYLCMINLRSTYIPHVLDTVWQEEVFWEYHTYFTIHLWDLAWRKCMTRLSKLEISNMPNNIKQLKSSLPFQMIKNNRSLETNTYSTYIHIKIESKYETQFQRMALSKYLFMIISTNELLAPAIFMLMNKLVYV